jgi:transposase-like protein
MSKPRRKHSAAEKAAVVRRHLADKVPVSTLAEELQVQPSQIHLWVKQVLDQADVAFQRSLKGGQIRREEEGKDRQIAQLQTQLAQKEAKLAQKNEVIAELMEENVRSKKANGGL